MIPYPFLQEDADCDCRYGCHPNFRARYEVLYGSASKVGHAEFTSPATPPRYYLKIETTWRCFDLANPPSADFWEIHAIDPETGAGSFEYSEPEMPGPGCPDSLVSEATATGGGFTRTVAIELPTLRLTTFTYEATPGVVAYRLQKLEVLSEEFTTRQLQDQVADNLPAWATDDETWPGANGIGDAPTGATLVATPLCYPGGGNPPGDPVEQLTAPAVWRLAENEADFELQRVRYRIVYPHARGASTFRVQWQEQFAPDGDTPESPTNAQTSDGDGVATESATFEITEVEENGENYIVAARFVPLT